MSKIQIAKDNVDSSLKKYLEILVSEAMEWKEQQIIDALSKCECHPEDDKCFREIYMNEVIGIIEAL
jgi:hypothetical protein